MTLPSDTAVQGSSYVTADRARLLDVRGLSVAFERRSGWVDVVSEVSVDVHENETVALVGESGSGKSVTCMSALGLIRHLGGRITAGSVELGGEDITHASERRLRALRSSFVGAIFQQPTRSLNPAFTIGDQVAEVLRVKRGMSRSAAWQESISLLDRVRIPSAERRARDYPHMMSGGMCQRVMIAIAIACQPRLLIADEPSTALDTTVQRQVLNLLEELQRDLSLGILYVSHDLGVVRDIADRVIVMYTGQVVESAPTEDVFERPRHPYTRGLILSTPGVSGVRRLGYIAGSIPDVDLLSPGCRFQDRCPMCVPECQSSPIELVDVGEGRTSRCIRTSEVLPAGEP